jgi:hypothetical protein
VKAMNDEEKRALALLCRATHEIGDSLVLLAAGGAELTQEKRAELLARAMAGELRGSRPPARSRNEPRNGPPRNGPPPPVLNLSSRTAAPPRCRVIYFCCMNGPTLDPDRQRTVSVVRVASLLESC